MKRHRSAQDDSPVPSSSDSSDSDSDSDTDVEDGQPSTDNTQATEAVAEDENEDKLIRALKKAREKAQRTCPPEVHFRKGGTFVDLSFHPSKNVLAASLLDGDIVLLEYTNECNRLCKRLSIHKSSVRSVEFDSSGGLLFSASKDKSCKVTDVETGQVAFKVLKSHSSALYKVKPLTEHLFASGDEDGTVKLWDCRRSSGKDAYSSVMEVKQFDEFVSDLFFDPQVDERTMVASSGEGTLLSFNLRGRKPDIQSEVYDGELNALAVVHQNGKLVAGCGNGRLYMFDWSMFGLHSADFPGHPDAINHLVAVTENVVVTACEDGTIRAVHLYPHRFVGTVGHHEQQFPVERLDVSGSGELIASISHDQKIKFWNISYLEHMHLRKSRKPYKQMKHKVRRKENRMRRAKEVEFQLPSSNLANRRDFFKDLAQD